MMMKQPESSGLHVHPLTEEGSELGDQISVISSDKQKKGGGLTHQLSDTSRFASVGWHADITFEPVPSDYAMLKIHTLPETGGDTVCHDEHLMIGMPSLIELEALGLRVRDLRPTFPLHGGFPRDTDSDSRGEIFPCRGGEAGESPSDHYSRIAAQSRSGA